MICFGDTARVRALTLAFLVVTSPALAQDLTLAVTPLDGLGVDATLLATLDAALAREVRELSMRTVAAPKKACDGDARCLADIGRAAGATRVLAGSVGLAGDELHIALKLIDVVNGDESRSIDEAAPLDQAELRLRAAATKLLKPDKYNQSGSIIVSVPVSGADVVVDGSARGTTPLFGPIDGLPPGRREVEVRYAGAKSWRGFVELRFGEPHRLELNLIDGALVEVPRALAAPKLDATAAAAGAGPDVLLLGGIGVTALGVAAAVAAIVAYEAAADAQRRINGDDISRKNIDDNRAAALASGTLATVSVLAVVSGIGLIAFSVVE